MQILHKINYVFFLKKKIRAKTWEHSYFGGLSEGHETSKRIYSYWPCFADNDYRAFLTGNQRIKFLFKRIIFHNFKLQINSFITT